MNRFFLGLLTPFFLMQSTPGWAQDELMPPHEQSPWQGIIMVVIAFAFFYLILWRPEQRRRKELERQRAALKKGDKVTAMGIIGTVDKIEEHTVILKMIDGAKIEFVKGAISEVVSSEDKAKA